MSRALKQAATLLFGLVFAGSVAACSSSSGAGEEQSEETSVLPPQIVEPTDLEGSSFEITQEQPLVVKVEDPTEWSGTTAHEDVAVFVPGEDDGSATFNPGFEAKNPGETEATLTSPEGETYDFTLVVP